MDFKIINFALPQTSGFLVDVIYWLISVSSSIAVGVILFTVILKLITFPFDLYSRVSMKKNSLLMEEMRPELEKLQRQQKAKNTHLPILRVKSLSLTFGRRGVIAVLPICTDSRVCVIGSEKRVTYAS